MTSTGSPESFQIPLEAAEVYESAFVPAFFSQWAPTLCEAAGLAEGMSVLDVGCGTGIVARTAADIVGASGKVVGVDLNDAMLTVATRVRPDLEWHRGDASALPFPDGSFDAVVSQMALMFIPDRQRAVAEMSRVARSAGTIALLVPGGLDTQPAFQPFVELAGRVAGPEAVSLLTTYFVCGDLDELAALVESAGLRVTSARPVMGTYRAPSVDAAVATEVESTPLAARIDDDTYRQLREGARVVFRPWTAPDGSLASPFACNVIAAARR